MEHVNARIIRNKLGLLNLAQELGNVSKACKVMGLSRDTFYRYLRYVIERIADHPINGIDELLPWNVCAKLALETRLAA